MQKIDIRELYYITHIDNLPSILARGVFSHERIESERIDSTPIYDADIVSLRNQITTPDKRSLWSYANLYFQ
ncbi:MAG: DarT ssDNA thymidine ADP-ribosyltransferase family protein [Candidatus Poribacteria bacterium]|nr:DarT ssDNA thymidine ADP-ribosyltransferase family protein [Candidatus Poribacteria bacterium]